MKTQYTLSPDGVRIAYDHCGEGPALVLLHGAGNTRQSWHNNGYVERLRDAFSVITIDLRGTGKSDRPTSVADYKIEKICGDILAVVDACDVEKFAIWGFSFGGNIARYLGAWSDRVSSIAVIGVPFGAAVHEDFEEYIQEFEAEWEPLVAQYDNPEQKGDLSTSARKAIGNGYIPVWLACFKAMREWPEIDPEALRCPALLVSGTRNPPMMAWIEANEHELKEAGIALEIVDGLTHREEFEKVEHVFPQVSAFLLCSAYQSAGILRAECE